jgi:hypothetical protein
MKNIFLTTICCLFLTTSIFASDFSKTSLVSPMFIRASETDTVFRNPAELTLHDRLTETRLTYGISDKKFGGIFLVHIPDNLPFYAGGRKNSLPLGDFAFSMEFFGTNFAQNMMWVADDDGGHFTLADGGYKMLFTWAKKTRFLTIGANLKVYRYRDINDPDSQRNATGFDLGMFFTPFKDLYLGAVANDVGSTFIKDNEGNAIQQNGQSMIIDQEIRFTAAVLSGKDMSFSVGVPLKLYDALKNDSRHAWKSLSFQGTKVFDNFFVVSAGSNTRDLYGSLILKLNDYIDFGVIGFRDLYVNNKVDFTLTFSVGYPIDKFLEHMKWTSKPQAPAKSYQRKTRHQIRMDQKRKEIELEKKRQYQETSNKKLDRIEKKLDRIESNKSTRKIDYQEDDAYKEIEEELDIKIENLKNKKIKLRKLKKKDQLRRELNALED